MAIPLHGVSLLGILWICSEAGFDCFHLELPDSSSGAPLLSVLPFQNLSYQLPHCTQRGWGGLYALCLNLGSVGVLGEYYSPQVLTVLDR